VTHGNGEASGSIYQFFSHYYQSAPPARIVL
jgi:hypothetical protein